MRLAMFSLGCMFLGLGFAEAQSKKSDVPGAIKKLSAKDPKERLAAITTIYEVGTVKAVYVKEAVTPLLVVLKSDADAKCRAEAAVTLGAIDPEDDKGVLAALVNAMKEDKDGTVQNAAIRGIGSLGAKAKELLGTLREMTKAAQAAVRKAKEELAAVRDDKEKAKLATARLRIAQGRAQALGAAVKNINSQLTQ
jgi:HEAT repeat protein